MIQIGRPTPERDDEHWQHRMIQAELLNQLRQEGDRLSTSLKELAETLKRAHARRAEEPHVENTRDSAQQPETDAAALRMPSPPGVSQDR